MAKEYRVEIRLQEVYVAYVVAEDEDEAESLASKQLNNGELDLISDTIEYEVEDA